MARIRIFNKPLSALEIAALDTLPSASLTSVAISPGSLSLAATGTGNLVAQANYADGTTSNVTSTATWTTSDPTVATVSALVVV